MQIRIDARPIGPLRVLPQLPDARLAILEGLNGIGKTLAIRLLEICTGTQPYPSSSQAWTSLCDGLGAFTVSVAGLQGNRTIVWEADSRQWPSTAEIPVSSWFTRISINGNPADLDDVRSLLAVYRIGGDEGIVETLAQQPDRASETMQRWSRRYASPRQGPLVQLEVIAGEARDLLGDQSLEGFRGLTATLESARVELTQASNDIEAKQKWRDQVAVAIETSDQLAEFRRREPGLTDQLRSIDAAIEQATKERDKLDQQIRNLAGRVAAAEPARRELSNARRTLERNREHLADYLNAAARAAAALKTSADRDAVVRLLRQLESNITKINAERAAVDAAHQMRLLLDQIIQRLSEADSRGLGDEVALELSISDLELTVDQTRAGMVAHRASLEGKPPPPRARELDDQLERAKRTSERVRHLVGLIDESARYRRLVGTNEERVNKALLSITPNAMGQMQSLDAERRAADDSLLELAAERASLREQLGIAGEETSEQILASQLQQALQRTGATESELHQLLADAEAALVRTQRVHSDAEERAREASRGLERVVAEAHRSWTALASHDRLTWIRETLPTSPKLSEITALQQQLALLDSVRHRVDNVIDRLGEFRGQLAAMESALRGVGRHLRGEDPETHRYVAQLQLWWSTHFSAWLNEDRVRRELLPEAEGAVTVDVQTREVRWIEKGAQRARPLEAFSSGEQAFTYTKARLSGLDDDVVRPSNRLIVLDEFGAFIAHDRLSVLLAYLQERSSEHLEDQVLVILPLSRDYRELADSTFGEDAKMFSLLADQIATRHYAVRELQK